MPFQAGFNKDVTFQVQGSNSQTTLNITGWSWAEMVDKLDVSHTGTTGQQAVIAGLLRGDGNVKANLDTSALINQISNPITAGAKGLIRKNVGSTTSFVIPVMVTKVNYQSAVEGKVEYNFDVTLDYIVGASMTSYTRPT